MPKFSQKYPAVLEKKLILLFLLFLVIFFGVGRGGGARISEFFTKNQNLKEKFGGGGFREGGGEGRGAGVSELFLL